MPGRCASSSAATRVANRPRCRAPVRGTKRAAQKVAASLTVEPPAPEGNRTVAEALDAWLEVSGPTWAVSTLRDQTSRVSLVKRDVMVVLPAPVWRRRGSRAPPVSARQVGVQHLLLPGAQRAGGAQGRTPREGGRERGGGGRSHRSGEANEVVPQTWARRGDVRGTAPSVIGRVAVAWREAGADGRPAGRSRLTS